MDALTHEQLEALELQMREQRDRLRALLDHTRDDDAPVALDLPIGRVSRIDAIQQQKMAAATRQSYARQLRELEAALDRLDRGAYGECADCAEPIAYKRLRARPEARLCLECQEDREQA
jgi:DnaK suppressor protein